MLLMPLGHRPLSIASADLSAYALPDGTLPLLCSSALGGSGPRTRSAAVCDSCLLTAAPGLVLAGLTIGAPDAAPPLRVMGSADEPCPGGQRFTSAARPRAPPAALA